MAIPQNITPKEIDLAINEIIKAEIPKERYSREYFLLHEDKHLPPKYVLSIANKYANGYELESNSFNAIEAKNFLTKHGYEILDRSFDFFELLLKFIEQSKKGGLSTKLYPSTFLEFTLKVSFGKGNQARVPWIAFLIKPNTVSNGIYPVYLYYKEKELLILAYGISETNKPESSWNISSAQTISKYFEENYSERPSRYGSSLIFRTYDLSVGDINKIKIENDLNELLDKYKMTTSNRGKKNQTKHSFKEINYNAKDILKKIESYISNKGFQYQYEEIANFYLALKTKPFVILAGISGTGKTQLPRKFAKAIGMNDSQVIQVPVRPDWADGSDLLGYTGINGTFKPKDLTLAILDARENPDKPFFFILDEMNLARVEHYFSDFLSIIETREWKNNKGSEILTNPLLRKEVIQNAENKNEFSEITWPDNLYLIGTVNMDETTHAFSRKVLDRANSIEMNEVNLDWLVPSEETISPLNDIGNSFFRTEFLGAIDISEEDRLSIKEEMDLLKRANNILQEADLHFAYRIRDELAFYLVLNKKYDLIPSQLAMDFQLVQKVLPRIHGSSERVQAVLVELLNLLEGTNLRAVDFDLDQINGKLKSEELKYPRSSKKIQFMLKRYEDDRFTSFWL